MEGVAAVAEWVRCAYETPRATQAGAEDLKTAQSDVYNKVVRRHLRDMQALTGKKAILVCWMEVC